MSLIWPARPAEGALPGLGDVVAALSTATRADAGAVLERWLDALDATGRWALLKLVTGGLRIGVSARLAKTAPPSGRGRATISRRCGTGWRRLMPISSPGSRARRRGRKPRAVRPLRPSCWRRRSKTRNCAASTLPIIAPSGNGTASASSLSRRSGERRLYSRSGDDSRSLSRAFGRNRAGGARRRAAGGARRHGGAVQRSSAAPQSQDARRPSCCATIRPWCGLRHDRGSGRGFAAAPLRCATAPSRSVVRRRGAAAFDLSPLVPFASWDELAAARAIRLGRRARGRGRRHHAEARAIRPIVSGRPRGPWLKWKRDPLTIDTVLMYAQRGHGKRSSFYSDYTFGVWRGDELVPVGKAYFGFTDEELRLLDRWIRDNTVDRFGPVREVAAGARARDRLRRRASLDPAQIGPRHALSRASTASAGTSPRGRPTGWRRWNGCWRASNTDAPRWAKNDLPVIPREGGCIQPLSP